ncbi:MAG: hypothetical protein P1U87_08310 [Verrucomicrobiales bacterium]|nr:hypothetical protein [Verrucomicrobiales bacterium]
MKTKFSSLVTFSGLLFLAGLLPGTLRADFVWDPAASTHTGAGTAFKQVTGPGVPAGTGSTTSGPVAYGGGQNTSGVFTFGFTNSTNPFPALGDTELSSTVLVAGTTLTLYFDKGATDSVNYVAIITDTTASITYEVISSTRVKIVANVVNPVASASGDLNAVFGLVIDYQNVPALNFEQTVFATNMHHFDVSPPATQPSGVAGINANGLNGTSAQFRAFMPITYLASIGLTDPSECKGYVDGIETPPGDFTNEGLDATLGFDFMDAGNPTNEVLKVVINNDSWSPHDMQFGKLSSPPVDPNIAKRATLRKKIAKQKKKLKKARTASAKKRVRKKIKKLKLQLRRLA